MILQRINIDLAIVHLHKNNKKRFGNSFQLFSKLNVPRRTNSQMMCNDFRRTNYAQYVEWR